DVRLSDGDAIEDQQLRAIRGPVRNLPASPFELRHHACAGRIEWAYGPYVHIAAVAARRAKRDAVSLVGPPRSGIARLPVGQKRNVAGGKVIAVELNTLASAHVFQKHERIALDRLVRDAVGYSIREERKLRSGASRELYL